MHGQQNVKIPSVTLITTLTSLVPITLSTLKNSGHNIKATEFALLAQSDDRGRSSILTHLEHIVIFK